jgi:hypothetical protein
MSNLPHKKKGEIHIKVKFYINSNSVLEVIAYERENRNAEKKKVDIQKNSENNEIRVENPNGLFLIMNALKNKENSIEYIEDELYRDTIKDLILKGEKEINDLKIKENGENNNKETIREKNKFIIEKFYTFIKEKLVKFNEGNKNNINQGEENNIIQEEKNNRRKYESKLILSYIKYYFKKVVYYLKNNKNDKIFRQTLFNSQNLGFILTEIQYLNTNLLPEMIEEFSDEKDFYEKCIVSLIENLYGKLTIEMNKKPFKDFDVDTLNKFNIEIDSIKNLFTKLTEPNPIEVRFIPNYLKALKLQIEGKLFILKYYNYNEFDIHIDKRLNELINSYSENSNADVDVLN